MNAPLHRSGVLAALVIALLVTACGSSTPTPSPSLAPSAPPSAPAAPSDAPSASAQPSASPAAAACDPDALPTDASPAPDNDDPNAALYEEIEAQVTQLRGIEAGKPVERGVFDKAGLCAYITKAFATENPESLIKGTEDLFKALLLMDQDANLEDLYIELLTSQVAGLYDDDAKKMFVVTNTGEIGGAEKITYAHEYTHALQDQRFVLGDLIGEDKDQGDRTLARTALVEGDATLLMSLWAQQHLSPDELAEAVSAADPGSEAILAKMPAILRETLIWPYTQGLQLTLRAFQGGGYGAIDQLYSTPPDSTEQVLHPEKLDAREAPVPVAFPDDFPGSLGTGWEIALEDTIGEYQLGILVGDAAGGANATEAAAGWGGDRVAWVTGPDGANAAILDTRWDTDADAAEFSAALAGYVAKLQAADRTAAILQPAPDRVVVISADGDDTLGKVANVLGLAD
ncbi:MAG TPA: hypothetical protein VFY23_13200 [Candidatus Limnocylindrales bacterium]|nr:hypothetical protein [Candidatus Limnocylindrales bacterium]